MSWRGPFDTSTDPDYVRWQSGELTEREYWSVRGEPYGLDVPFTDPVGSLERIEAALAPQ